MDEGLAGRQRQFEVWIHNLSKELNHYKAANLELSNKLRELCGSTSQPKEHAKGKCILRSECLLLLICLIIIIVVFTPWSEMALDTHVIKPYFASCHIKWLVPISLHLHLGKSTSQSFVLNLTYFLYLYSPLHFCHTATNSVRKQKNYP